MCLLNFGSQFGVENVYFDWPTIPPLLHLQFTNLYTIFLCLDFHHINQSFYFQPGEIDGSTSWGERWLFVFLTLMKLFQEHHCLPPFHNHQINFKIHKSKITKTRHYYRLLSSSLDIQYSFKTLKIACVGKKIFT